MLRMKEMDRLQGNVRPGSAEWIGKRDDSISLDVTSDGIWLSAFYFGDYPDDPGGMNCHVGPVFVSWEELAELRSLSENAR
jgi:hypothetical protein